MAQDSRGYNEIVIVKHENSFNTFASYASTAPSTDKIISSITGKSFKVTDFCFNAATASTFTLLQNTTTSLFSYSLAAGASQSFILGTPLTLATSAGIHITISGTGASTYIGGYYI